MFENKLDSRIPNYNNSSYAYLALGPHCDEPITAVRCHVRFKFETRC